MKLKLYELVVPSAVPKLAWTDSIHSLVAAKTAREMAEKEKEKLSPTSAGGTDGKDEGKGKDEVEVQVEVFPFEAITIQICTSVLLMVTIGTASPMVSMVAAIGIWIDISVKQAIIGAFMGTLSVAEKKTSSISSEEGNAVVASVLCVRNQLKIDCQNTPAVPWKSRYFFSIVFMLVHALIAFDTFAGEATWWVLFVIYGSVALVSEVLFAFIGSRAGKAAAKPEEERVVVKNQLHVLNEPF